MKPHKSKSHFEIQSAIQKNKMQKSENFDIIFKYMYMWCAAFQRIVLQHNVPAMIHQRCIQQQWYKNVSGRNMRFSDLRNEHAAACIPVLTVATVLFLFLLLFSSSSHGYTFITVIFLISTICTISVSTSPSYAPRTSSTYNTVFQYNNNHVSLILIYLIIIIIEKNKSSQLTY